MRPVNYTDENIKDVHAPCEDERGCNRKDLDCKKCRDMCVAADAQRAMLDEMDKHFKIGDKFGQYVVDIAYIKELRQQLEGVKDDEIPEIPF